jgi:hypothetical protein
MSLTRAQWVELWNSLRRIEQLAHQAGFPRSLKGALLREVRLQKELIQSVTGQME